MIIISPTMQDRKISPINPSISGKFNEKMFEVLNYFKFKMLMAHTNAECRDNLTKLLIRPLICDKFEVDIREHLLSGFCMIDTYWWLMFFS